jgi:two-component system, NarL family, nitrate/nitrite response regulator NarL
MKITIADGHQPCRIRLYLSLRIRLLRDGLARAFRSHTDMEVVGCGRPCETTPEQVAGAECDVVLVDWIDHQWLSQTKLLGQTGSRSIKFVAIGMSAAPESFLEAVSIGVVGYLLRDASFSDVIAAVRATSRGEAICPPVFSAVLFQAFADMGQFWNSMKAESHSSLTLRQKELMKLVDRGLTNKEIAVQMGISVFTVKNHVSRILRHLGVESRSEAAGACRTIQKTMFGDTRTRVQ